MWVLRDSTGKILSVFSGACLMVVTAQLILTPLVYAESLLGILCLSLSFFLSAPPLPPHLKNKEHTKETYLKRF